MVRGTGEGNRWLDQPVSRRTRAVVTAAAIALIALAAGSAIAAMLRADGGDLLGITPGVLGVLAALVSWWLVSPRAFVALGWGRLWVGVGIVGLSPTIASVLLPVGAVVWFVYQRPRLRRSIVEARAIAR